MNNTPKFIGRFPIIDVLGVGGMGVVYSAKDPDIGRKVAIKVLHTTGEKDALKRFKNEARTMGEISHPNIVILLEYGIHDNKPFLVMEYLSGLSLGKWIKQKHTLKEHKKILIQLCDALKFAHNKNILHRDLKPDNIQILTNGDAKLLDFGIATGEDKGLTATGFFIGTPKYLAPEILEDTTHTKSSDCYSLGLLAYTMLSGDNPFAAETFEASMTRILTKIPTPLSQLNPAIPKELSDIIDSYLVKNPAQRPKTPEKLKLALELIHKPAVLNREIDANKNIENHRSFEKTVLAGQVPRNKKKWLSSLVIVLTLISIIGFYVHNYMNAPISENDLNNLKTTTNIQDTTSDARDDEKSIHKENPNINNVTGDELAKNSLEISEILDSKPEVQKNTNNQAQKTAETTDTSIVKKDTTTANKKLDILKTKPKAKQTQLKKPTKIEETAVKIDTITENPHVAYQKPIDIPIDKPKDNPIVKLPSFAQNSKKIALVTQSDTQISRGRTKSLILDVPDGIKFDKFKLKRGLSDFTQVEIKNTKQLNKNQIQIDLYAQSNATMGDFSLIGYYKKHKTKPLILEITL
jgi:serine/threonine protein kinase